MSVLDPPTIDEMVGIWLNLLDDAERLSSISGYVHATAQRQTKLTLDTMMSHEHQMPAATRRIAREIAWRHNHPDQPLPDSRAHDAEDQPCHCALCRVEWEQCRCSHCRFVRQQPLKPIAAPLLVSPSRLASAS